MNSGQCEYFNFINMVYQGSELNEPTNKTLIKPYYKTMRTNVINIPMSPLSQMVSYVSSCFRDSCKFLFQTKELT